MFYVMSLQLCHNKPPYRIIALHNQYRILYLHCTMLQWISKQSVKVFARFCCKAADGKAHEAANAHWSLSGKKQRREVAEVLYSF